MGEKFHTGSGKVNHPVAGVGVPLRMGIQAVSLPLKRDSGKADWGTFHPTPPLPVTIGP